MATLGDAGGDTGGGGREGGVHAGGRCVELPVDQDNSNDG